ncbi:ABC transporter permease [Roseivirga sp. E12]|uniref:ABC transporter permease n=1 Tax=Roseivirga sp. E12 TaxID=2819237 RepID=UPI001ABC4394|nr:ABC transporter permease [Roseivirga sp. E12]MBO3698183.1 ABC transporter permease [Roseivirga sp. E12]
MGIKHKNARPPRFAKWLLKSFCSYDFLSTALWDLEELFHHNIKVKGLSKARLFYTMEVFGIIIHLFFKGKSQYSTNKIAMLKHNLLISIRSFKRFKSTFFINLIGLATGLASTLLIYLWVVDEMSIDKFHEKDDQIYQVMRNRNQNGIINTTSTMPGPLAEELRTNYPEVESASMIWAPEFFGSKGYISMEDKQIRAKAQYVDAGFMKIMSVPLVSGNPNAALKSKTEVLISESLAQKVFGTIDNLIGKTLHWNEGKMSGDYMISGIFEDVPDNSSMQFDMLLNAKVMIDARKYMEEWGNTNPDVVVLLKEGTSADQFDAKITKLIQAKRPKSSGTLFIQKFSDRYLKGSYENGTVSGGRIVYVRLFSIVAMIILAIACINFMNLSTAKATGRLKEIGVKKALGAKRKALLTQYYTESFLMTIISMAMALIMARSLLPQFSQITGKALNINFTSELAIGIGVILLFTGLLAGSYPALYLSRLKTTESLKGKLAKSFSELLVRKGLVIFQFSASIILIFSVLIVSKQIDYIQNKNLGYNRENIVKFDNTGIDDSAYPGFVSSLESIPGVLSTASTGHDLTGDHGSTRLSWPGKKTDDKTMFINLEMSPRFIETMGIELVQGRTFERGRINEDKKIIFNETAIKQMDLEDPVGKIINLWGREKEIIGVVKDFHAESLYETIQPTLIQAYPVLNSTIVRIQKETIPNTLASIEERFEEFSNGLPFEFSFMDSDYQAMYQSEKRISSLSKFFAIVAAIISCLGLLGLTAFTAEKRTKEIGIRKVLGSGNWKIVGLLSLDFAKMVLVALVIGLPLSYFIAQGWLENFKYSIALSPWHFLLSGSIIVAISWLTVSFQTFKAARTNPVDALRSE